MNIVRKHRDNLPVSWVGSSSNTVKRAVCAILLIGAGAIVGCPTNPDLGNVGDLFDSGNSARPGAEQVFVLVRNQSGLNAFARVSMRVNGVRVHLAERLLSPSRNLIILGPEETDSITFEGFRGADADPANMQSIPIEVRDRGVNFEGGDVIEFIIPPIPDFGGCCNYVDVSASCRLAYASDCVSSGGNFLGTGSNCEQNSCPARGACCLSSASGDCHLLTEAECGSAGGQFLGGGQSCAAPSCVVQPPSGACCVGGNSCAILNASECANLSGDFRGAGTVCPIANCPPEPPVGACCFQTGSCSAITAANCATLGGTYKGDATSCDTANCPTPPPPPPPPAQGACCMSDGACQNLTANGCSVIAGTFLGTSTTCQTVQCIDVRPGACCFADGSCSSLSESDCHSAGGEFRGHGASCATADCPQPPPVVGACCLPVAINCSVTTAANCAELSGVYQGDGTVCEPSPCVPASGACCVGGKGGYECSIKTEADCVENVGGRYAGDGSTCTSEACGGLIFGACCLRISGETYCSPTTVDECYSLGGSFFGETTSCADVVCEPPPGIGACCLSGGTESICVPLLGDECNVSGGLFYGVGSNCELARCSIVDIWETAEVDYHADAPFPRQSYRVYPRSGGGAPAPVQDDPTEPSLVFDAPLDGAICMAGQPMTIGWAARDDDSNARIWILMDPLPSQRGDVIVLREAVEEDDIADRETILDSSSLAAGAYEIIGIISDGRTLNIVHGPTIHVNPAGESDGVTIEGH